MIRVTLHDQGVAYEEVHPAWSPEAKTAGMADGSLPFGQLPRFVTEDGTSIVQSGAIMRHLGRTLSLYGSSPTEAALVDQVYEEVADWRRAYSKLVYVDALAPDALAAYKAGFADRAARGGGYVGHLEAFAKAHGGPFVCGSFLSIADYLLFELLNTHLREQFMPALFETYELPTLAAWYAAMSARPALKAYVESGAAHRAAANGNGLA